MSSRASLDRQLPFPIQMVNLQKSQALSCMSGIIALLSCLNHDNDLQPSAQPRLLVRLFYQVEGIFCTDHFAKSTFSGIHVGLSRIFSYNISHELWARIALHTIFCDVLCFLQSCDACLSPLFGNLYNKGNEF